MSVDPRITAATAAARERARLRDAILVERQRTRTQIVLAPPVQPRIRTHQSLPTAPAPAPTPATDEQLASLLDTLLVPILAGVAQARAAYGDRRITLPEAAALGVTVMTIVSAAVHALPVIESTNARALVLLVYGVLWDRYVMPLLPAYLRPFAGRVKGRIIELLETLYRAVVNRRVAQPL
ncbi:hypothetical protein QOL99_00055 [Deinococcus sp. MIMF12]|uniref:Uncharacterized protein n=1 Tax=Deinococcus rhizophilus TaxID=3049544 RepID=A0ABT7JBV2_9DEIO|nr:hypothetical protein [Deinococcus rhizophilus]MDL2342540.1 hypothetical protein [Deinococcus rhizophilus]